MSGHIFDMVNRIKQNTTQKRKKFRGDNRAMMYSEKIDTDTEYDFPKVSEFEMERMKLRIQREAKTGNHKLLYSFIVSLLIAALVIWAIVTFYDLNKYSHF